MDLCITAPEPFNCSPPGSRSRSSTTPTSSPYRTHHSPGSAITTTTSSPAALTQLPPVPPPKDLEFDLVIYDPSNDSSLTHPWDLPQQPLRIPLATSKSQLLQVLRTHLPYGKDRIRRPKLAAVTLYWTFRGMILPLGPNDNEWHYRNPITKTDLLGRAEMEWFLLKEMMASSGGALKCYLVIRGEIVPVKKTGTWWFGAST